MSGSRARHSFEFATANRVIFGSGRAADLGTIGLEFGSRCLLITGSHSERVRTVTQSLSESGIQFIVETVSGEPTIHRVEEIARGVEGFAPEFVIGCGGGSVVDAAKAVAALRTNSRNLLDYLEVIGSGRSLENQPLPCIAVPTTSGTGAEVTRNSVLASPEHRVKVSLRSPSMLPDVALLDPDLTLSAPPALTASTGLDALTQLIEPFVCTRANPLTDGFCLEGIALAARSLRNVFADGDNQDARQDMMMASLYGGLALANSGLGAVHGFAGPIGGMYEAAHGAVCAALLPHVMRKNIDRLKESGDQGNDVLARYTEIARLLTGRPNAELVEGIEWVQETVSLLGIQGLRSIGIPEGELGLVCEKAKKASSMRPNPVSLSQEDLLYILKASL